MSDRDQRASAFGLAPGRAPATTSLFSLSPSLNTQHSNVEFILLLLFKEEEEEEEVKKRNDDDDCSPRCI